MFNLRAQKRWCGQPTTPGLILCILTTAWVLACVLVAVPGSGQIPTLTSGPAGARPPAANQPRTQAGAFTEALRQQALGAVRGLGVMDPGTGTGTGRGTGTPTGSVGPVGPVGSAAAGLLPYDATLDNRLPAPTEAIGLFGQPIRMVERRLREFGARPTSYVFGKTSNMSLSVYDLQLDFDRYRRLGRVVITPRPPFERVPVQAQQFFTELFLAGSRLESFSLGIEPNRFTIEFRP